MNRTFAEDTDKKKRIEENRKAFEDLMSLCKPIPDLDAKKELQESREERFLHGA